MAGPGAEQESPGFDVRVVYSRSRYWAAPLGEVRRGGCYSLRLSDFSWQEGVGATIEAGLADLARALRYWVEQFDDYEPPSDYPEEPSAIRRIRAAVRRGSLLDELRGGLREPVLDPDDEPPPPVPR